MTPPVALAPVGPPAARPRPPDPTAPRYVRKVKGWKFQARLWVGYENGGTVNLGLYPSESAAAQAVRATIRRLSGRPSPLAVWSAVMATGLAPARLLPQHVRRRPDGTFGYVVRRSGVRRQVVGRFPTPEEAHQAAVAAFARPHHR